MYSCLESRTCVSNLISCLHVSTISCIIRRDKSKDGCMSIKNFFFRFIQNDFTQINASILFLTGEKQYTNQIESYRQRLKSRNGLMELGECNEKLLMSENGKYRFRLPQQLVDKLIMVLRKKAIVVLVEEDFSFRKKSSILLQSFRRNPRVMKWMRN